MIPATANLTCAITKGWEDSRAILVAVDADAHKNANKTPAPIHLEVDDLMVEYWKLNIEGWRTLDYKLCISGFFEK